MDDPFQVSQNRIHILLLKSDQYRWICCVIFTKMPHQNNTEGFVRNKPAAYVLDEDLFHNCDEPQLNICGDK